MIYLETEAWDSLIGNDGDNKMDTFFWQACILAENRPYFDDQ